MNQLQRYSPFYLRFSGNEYVTYCSGSLNPSGKGGSGSDAFYFRGAVESTYNAYSLLPAATRVQDFAAGERVLLDGAQTPSGLYDANGYAILRDMVRSDISLSRSGGDLVLTGPDVGGIYAGHPTMTIEGFFTRGLTSIDIDGTVTNVSGL